MRGLSPAAASGGHSSSRCAGLSPLRPLLLWSTSSRRAGSVVVAHGPSCSAACGISPDQGSNPCPLHRQADSQPLCHQGSPIFSISYSIKFCQCLSVTVSISPSFFKNQFIYFIYLFLAALCLRCCAQAFSSCSEWGLLFVAVCVLLTAVASLVVEHGL